MAANKTAQYLTQALDAVKALLAAGVIDPASLGLAPRASSGPEAPIKLKKLAKKSYNGLTPESARTYRTYIDLLVKGWPAEAPKSERLYRGLGNRWAHEVRKADLEEALTFVEQRACLHAHWRAENRRAVGRTARTTNGAMARATAVAAWRKMFTEAEDNEHLAPGKNPAAKVRKPKPSRGERMPIKAENMPEFWDVVGGTGDDPVLDALMCETILVSGARREGLLNLSLGGLNREACTVRLDEKFGKVVDQPVPDWLVEKLYRFAVARGAQEPDDKVFRKRGKAGGAARPITSRRFDYIFQRLQAACDWADKEQVTAHVLRHHSIAMVERRFSKAVSIAFARHEPDGTNSEYGKASKAEVAWAVTQLHGGSHPLVQAAGGPDA